MHDSHVIPVRRALLSVSDKTGLIPFAAALAKRGVTILSTGGTAKALTEAGVAVTPIERVTGFPEGLDGRVKTLHPMVHGGLLARHNDAQHDEFCRVHGIERIDLVCINLYPFERVSGDAGASFATVVENIDVGGPAMVRAAAKNHERVAVLTSPSQYQDVLDDLERNGGGTSLGLRGRLAAAAFGSTAAYDACIAAYLAAQLDVPTDESADGAAVFGDRLALRYGKVEDLRYGENPHQAAALYRDPGHRGASVVTASRLHGKALSYNNINDGAGALDAVMALSRRHPELAGACVVKHAAPCGLAVSSSAWRAAELAIAGDPLAAYGGIFATNRGVCAETAGVLAHESRYFEVVIAPHFDEDALEILKRRSVNLRLLATGAMETASESAADSASRFQLRSVAGGLLVQEPDLTSSGSAAGAGRRPSAGWVHAAGPAPTEAQLATAEVLEVAAAMLMSNAVVVGGPADPAGGDGGRGEIMLLGTGGGQPDRVWASRLAAERAKAGHARHLESGSVVAFSDAFFPFPDGPEILIGAGVRCIVHPGGSKRDDETFELCNRTGTTCLTTGVRHFRH